MILVSSPSSAANQQPAEVAELPVAMATGEGGAPGVDQGGEPLNAAVPLNAPAMTGSGRGRRRACHEVGGTGSGLP